MSHYECNDHKLEFACLGCVKVWVERHNRMKDFLFEMIKPLADRDDYFQAWQDEANELLVEIGLKDQNQCYVCKGMHLNGVACATLTSL